MSKVSIWHFSIFGSSAELMILIIRKKPCFSVKTCYSNPCCLFKQCCLRESSFQHLSYLACLSPRWNRACKRQHSLNQVFNSRISYKETTYKSFHGLTNTYFPLLLISWKIQEHSSKWNVQFSISSEKKTWFKPSSLYRDL